MTQQEWQRAKEVLALAVERPLEDRPALLREHCGEDTSFRQLIEGFLRDYDGHASLEDFLRSRQASTPDRGAGDAASPLPSTLVPGPAGDTTVPRANAPTWGDFVLLEELGRGGFGVVYRAWERPLKREVALKIIDLRRWADVPDDGFLREGQMLARVNHANVVKLYSASRVGHELALAMEYVRGQTLASLVDRHGPFAPRDAATTVAALCGALAAVHRGGLVHRDIKASNVMRADDGRIVLMDFGAGREWVHEPHTWSRMIGTPAYMAPEVLAGDTATPAADVYSLGVLLFYLLTARYPQGMPSSPASDAAIVAWLRQRLPHVPDPLGRLALRMLDDEPSRRPPVGSALKRELNQSARPSAPPAEARRQTPTPTPTPPPFAEVPVESTAAAPARRSWPAWAGGGAASIAGCLAIGVLSTAEYNQVLGRHGVFAAEPLSAAFVVGMKSLLLPLLLTLATLVVAALALFAWRVGCAVAPRATERLCDRLDDVKRAFAARGMLTRAIVEPAVCLAGLVACVAILWAYSGFVTALTTSIDDGPASVFGVLHSGLRDEKGRFRTLLLLLMLALLASRLLTRRLSDDGASRVASGSVLAMAALIGVIVAGSWRVLYTRTYREVLYGSERCYVLGEHQAELLVHCPERQPPRNRVIRTDDVRTNLTGRVGSPFDAYPPVPGYVPKPLD